MFCYIKRLLLWCIYLSTVYFIIDLFLYEYTGDVRAYRTTLGGLRGNYNFKFTYVSFNPLKTRFGRFFNRLVLLINIIILVDENSRCNSSRFS